MRHAPPLVLALSTMVMGCTPIVLDASSADDRRIAACRLAQQPAILTRADGTRAEAVDIRVYADSVAWTAPVSLVRYTVPHA